MVFHHFRDKGGIEVDVVMERGGRLMVGVEIKAAATVTIEDLKGLRKLKETVVDRFVAGWCSTMVNQSHPSAMACWPGQFPSCGNYRK